MGDDRGIDRVGLGEAAERLGELADLARIDDRHRQAGLGQGHRDVSLIAAARLQDDENRHQQTHPLRQLGEVLTIGAATERLTIGSNVDVDPGLRYVDADKALGDGLAFHDPASSMRARAQTTVRACGKPAGATRSPAAFMTRNHAGYRLGSASQDSPTNQAMPR